MPNSSETHWVIWGGEAAGTFLPSIPCWKLRHLDLLWPPRQNDSVTIGPTSEPTPAKGLRRCSSRAFPARIYRQSLDILARSNWQRVRSAGANPDAPEMGASESPRSGRRINTPPAGSPSSLRRQTPSHPTSVPAARLDSEDRGQKPSDRTRQRPRAQGCVRLGLVERKVGFCGSPLFHVNAQNRHRAHGLGDGWPCALGTPQVTAPQD